MYDVRVGSERRVLVFFFFRRAAGQNCMPDAPVMQCRWEKYTIGGVDINMEEKKTLNIEEVFNIPPEKFETRLH